MPSKPKKSPRRVLKTELTSKRLLRLRFGSGRMLVDESAFQNHGPKSCIQRRTAEFPFRKSCCELQKATFSVLELAASHFGMRKSLQSSSRASAGLENTKLQACERVLSLDGFLVTQPNMSRTGGQLEAWTLDCVWDPCPYFASSGIARGTLSPCLEG